jgi:hypothetical protein
MSKSIHNIGGEGLATATSIVAHRELAAQEPAGGAK